MMETDIGSYIQANSKQLTCWGQFVAESAREKWGDAIKIPCVPRVKDAASARAKVLKKQYTDPVREMTDLVGARIVVLTADFLEPVCKWIEGNPAWSARKSRDIEDVVAKNAKVFDYQSHHYEVRPATVHRFPSCEVGAEYCCEVQVRTLLQHAYAEIVHDNVYKASGPVPSRAERLLARSMALMEATDEQFCRALDEIGRENRPLDLLVETAKSVAGATTQEDNSLCCYVTSLIREHVDSDSARQLRQLFADMPGLLRRLTPSAKGLFEFRATAVIAYWLCHTHEGRAKLIWPLPASSTEIELILADLGISPE